MDYCTLLEKTPNCTTTGIEREVAMSRQFGSSELDVCKKLIKHLSGYHAANGYAPLYNYTPGEEIRACWFKGGGDSKCYDIEYILFHPKQTDAHCVYDSNEDGDIDANDGSWVVSYRQITPEAHCFCTPNGPHASVTPADWDPVTPAWKYGIELSNEFFLHYFQTGFKKHILERNWDKNGKKLDRNGMKLYKSEAVFKVPSVLNPMNKTTFDPEPTLQKWNLDDADAAQVDHIIPRKDSQGCLCGDPTPNNAAIISQELNQTMSNISPKWNIDRARMYEKYVTCPDPSVAQYQGRNVAQLTSSTAQLQSDESMMCADREEDPYREPPRAYVASREPAVETGGCSTSRAGGIGIAFAFLAVRRRRRCT